MIEKVFLPETTYSLIVGIFPSVHIFLLSSILMILSFSYSSSSFALFPTGVYHEENAQVNLRVNLAIVVSLLLKFGLLRRDSSCTLGIHSFVRSRLYLLSK